MTLPHVHVIENFGQLNRVSRIFNLPRPTTSFAPIDVQIKVPASVQSTNKPSPGPHLEYQIMLQSCEVHVRRFAFSRCFSCSLPGSREIIKFICAEKIWKQEREFDTLALYYCNAVASSTRIPKEDPMSFGDHVNAVVRQIDTVEVGYRTLVEGEGTWNSRMIWNITIFTSKWSTSYTSTIGSYVVVRSCCTWSSRVECWVTTGGVQENE